MLVFFLKNRDLMKTGLGGCWLGVSCDRLLKACHKKKTSSTRANFSRCLVDGHGILRTGLDSAKTKVDEIQSP